MKNCKLCGEPTDNTFCNEDHRREYYYRVIIGENTCVSCGRQFGVTTSRRMRQFCYAPECRLASKQRGGAAKAAAAKQAATRPSQQVRATYCVRHDPQPIRCKHHLEDTCRYRVKGGQPVCRVEPAHVAEANYYRSSLAGAATILRMVQR